MQILTKCSLLLVIFRKIKDGEVFREKKIDICKKIFIFPMTKYPKASTRQFQ